MIGLESLSPKKGSVKAKRRIGLGRGSGMGETSTRGQKGQWARSGNRKRESGSGGQVELLRRVPKSGFNNARFRKEVSTVNVSSFEKYSSIADITPKVMKEKGLVSCDKYVKVLGNGEVKSAINVSAHSFSKGAVKKIEAKGGIVTTIKPAVKKESETGK